MFAFPFTLLPHLSRISSPSCDIFACAPTLSRPPFTHLSLISPVTYGSLTSFVYFLPFRFYFPSLLLSFYLYVFLLFCIFQSFCLFLSIFFNILIDFFFTFLVSVNHTSMVITVICLQFPLSPNSHHYLPSLYYLLSLTLLIIIGISLVSLTQFPPTPCYTFLFPSLVHTFP